MNKKGHMFLGVCGIVLLIMFSNSASSNRASNSADELSDLKARMRALEGSLRQDVPPNVPLGTIVPYAGFIDATHPLPEGWRLCNGDDLSRTGEYAQLFRVFGTAWGTKDGSTFKLPDLRGLFLRGIDGEARRDPDVSERNANGVGNPAGVGSTQDDTMKAHSHGVNENPHSHLINDPAHGHDFVFFDNSGGGNPGSAFPSNGKAGRTHDSKTGITIQPNVTGISIKEFGYHETRPKNAYVYWIIKAK